MWKRMGITDLIQHVEEDERVEALRGWV